MSRHQLVSDITSAACMAHNCQACSGYTDNTLDPDLCDHSCHDDAYRAYLTDGLSDAADNEGTR